MPKGSTCRYPQHHDAGRSGGSGVLLVLAVLVGLVVLVVVRFVMAHLWWFAVSAAVVVVLVTVVAVVRFARLDRAGKWHWFLCRWHRLGWKRLARNLQLALPDRHRGGIDSTLPKKVNYPRRVRFRPDSFGWTVAFRPPPGVTREHVEARVESLADRWRCARVGVSKPSPGRLVVRACRRDPLTVPLSPAVLPSRFDGRRLVLGADEWGDIRYLDLSNTSGSVCSGLPGMGKTESAASLAVQLVPSSLVDVHILDGGAADWQPFAPAVASYAADDLGDAEELLLELHAKMCARRRNLQQDLGGRNGWHRGPESGYRLQWLLIEEAPWFLDLDSCKGDKAREAKVRAIRGMVMNLLRRGRAPLFHTTILSQKATGTGGCPPDIRDLCSARWAFACTTIEMAAGGLGDDIRSYPSYCPVQLQADEYRGVATCLLKTGLMPYTFVRFPAIGELVDQVARQAAQRRAARDSVPAVSAPDGARELVG